MGGRRLWKVDETEALLKSWKNHVYMYRFLRACSSKEPVYAAIFRDLRKQGFTRSLFEIKYKMKNFRHRCEDSRWAKEIQEIKKLQKIEQNQTSTALDKEQASELLYGSDADVSETVEVVTTDVPNAEKGSDSETLSHTTIQYPEAEIPNNTRVSLPQSTSINPKISARTILSNICREFQNSNRQLEKNDIAILKLFNEQNDIFRQQTQMLMKFL